MDHSSVVHRRRKLPEFLNTSEQKRRRKEHEQQVRDFMHSLKPVKAPTPTTTTATDAEPTHCPICTEKYSSRHKRLPCPYSCGGEACTVCHTRYLQEATTDFHCMKCRREWKLRFMRTHFSDKQLQTLYHQYQKVLLARDETKLPEAQQILENQRKVRKLNHKIYVLEDQIRKHREEQTRLRTNRRTKLAWHERDGPPVKCLTLECRGYLKRGICGVCNKRYCLKCWQQLARPLRKKPAALPSDAKDEGEEEVYDVAPPAASSSAAAASSASGLVGLHKHVCPPEALANMEYLRSNSKTCPRCGVWTSRTEGCNQMWCINCHVGWDWSTGLEIHGVIHNPHFFEWQRRTQAGHVERTPGDVPCGGLPFQFPSREFEDHLYLNNVLRRLNEINDTRVLHPPRERPTLDVQLKYLNQQLSREAWSQAVFRRYKLFKFQEQFYHIHQMFYLAASDILQRRFRHAVTAEGVKGELEALRVYYNRELLETVRVNKARAVKLYKLVSPSWELKTWEHQPTVDEALALAW